MKTFIATSLFVTSALLLLSAQPLPPDVIALPGMDGSYCFTGETYRLDQIDEYKYLVNDPSAKFFILAQILFTNTGLKIEIPVERTYPLYPPCRNNPVKI